MQSINFIVKYTLRKARKNDCISDHEEDDSVSCWAPSYIYRN